MYTLLQSLSARQLLLAQLPALFASLLIAETFYKLGSFTLEAVAFLGTWFLIDAAIHAGTQWIESRARRR
jgi:hypothetical protein